MNYIVQYWNKIESGEILVNRKMRRTIKKAMDDLMKSDRGEGEWVFDEELAQHPIDFIEQFCRYDKGKKANQKVKLELWQKAIISIVFGFIHYDTEERKYREAVIFIPRKNGKSALSSWITLYMLYADGEYGAEIACAATKRDIAKIVFDSAKSIVKKSPALSKRSNIRRTDLWVESTESKFYPLASDYNTLDGLNLSCFVGDEIHAWVDNMALYDVLKDSMVARANPLTFLISTMGTVRGSTFDTIYELAEKTIKGYDDGNYINERTIYFIFELDDPKINIHKPETWGMCNPMFDVVINVDQLIEKYERAKQQPHLLINFLTKHFNIRSSSSVSWLQWEQYNNEDTFNLEEMGFRYFISGADLSKCGDWTAACALMKLPGDEIFYVENMYWITRRQFEDNPSKLPLETWYEQGYFRICEGEKIDHKEIIEWFLELQNGKDIYLYKCGYDAWSSSLFVDTMEQTFGEVTITPVHQGAKTLSSPMFHLESLLKEKKVNYGNNPITKMHIGNTSVLVDTNGNIKPNKGGTQQQKIDGLACLLNALVVYLDNADEYESMI